MPETDVAMTIVMNLKPPLAKLGNELPNTTAAAVAVSDELKEVRKSIDAMSESSSRLATAMNILTAVGVVIAVIALFAE